MNYKFINKIDGDKAEVLLHGDIGFEINGIELGKEIDSLVEQGVKEIKIRINSGGGNIIEGFSIVSAIMLARKTVNIITVNEGLAASMAGVIFVTGNERHMFDFAQLMLHNPSFFGESLEDIKDGKIKTALTALRDSLVMIVKNATGKSKKELENIFTAESWFNATEAKTEGFATKKITFSNSPPINNSMSVEEIMSKATAFLGTQKEKENFKPNNTNKMDLKQINNKLGLDVNTSEDGAINAITNMQSERATAVNDLKAEKEVTAVLTGEKESLTNEIATLKNTIKAHDEEKKEIIKSQVVAVVKQAVKDGKLDAKREDEMVEKFADNLDGITMVVENITTPHPGPINNLLNSNRKSDGKNDPEKTYEWYTKNDCKGLEAMTTKDRNALYVAQYGEENED